MFKKSVLNKISSVEGSPYYQKRHGEVFVMLDGEFLGWCFFADQLAGEVHIYVTNAWGEMLSQTNDSMEPATQVLRGTVELLEVDC